MGAGGTLSERSATHIGVLRLRKRSCPAVSQISNCTVRVGVSTRRVRYAALIVLRVFSWYSSRTNRISNDDFPTPLSPMMI